jgi:hypothetical protein
MSCAQSTRTRVSALVAQRRSKRKVGSAEAVISPSPIKARSTDGYHAPLHARRQTLQQRALNLPVARWKGNRVQCRQSARVEVILAHESAIGD